MWDLHHREWLLSSLEARAAPSRQHSNLYLSAGLSVYINCDSEIQTSFSMHAVPGHKKSYFHYSPKINSNLESAGRWPSSPRFEHFCYKIECSKLTQHTRLLGNISGDFGIFSGALAVCKSLSLRAFSSVCPMYALPRCCVSIMRAFVHLVGEVSEGLSPRLVHDVCVWCWHKALAQEEEKDPWLRWLPASHQHTQPDPIITIKCV